MHKHLGSLVTLRSDKSAGCGVSFYPGPNDCGDTEQVCMISNQVQVKVISDAGYGPFCDIYETTCRDDTLFGFCDSGQ